MKKILFVFICMFVITSCGAKEEKKVEEKTNLGEVKKDISKEVQKDVEEERKEVLGNEMEKQAAIRKAITSKEFMEKFEAETKDMTDAMKIMEKKVEMQKAYLQEKFPKEEIEDFLQELDESLAVFKQSK